MQLENCLLFFSELTEEEKVTLSSLREQNSDQSCENVQKEPFSSGYCEESRLTPYLTSGEADRLCSVIQSFDSSFKKDHPVTETSSQLGEYLTSENENVDNSDYHLPESVEVESVKEGLSSYSRLVDKHRTRVKELLLCLQSKSQESLLEASFSGSETKGMWEDTANDEVAFQRKLHEAELAIGSAEMFLPSFRETLARITKIISKQIEDLIQKLTESEMEVAVLKNEVVQKERYILELSIQLQEENVNVLKASRHSESVQSVQTHLQCQIEKKEAENNQRRSKIQTLEKQIYEWKRGEHKQQILTEKERREERKIALQRAAHVQRQRAKHAKAAVRHLISKIREKEIQLSEAVSASDVWKSHHETVVDEKNRLEVQADNLRKQIADRAMDLKRIQDARRKAKNELIGQIHSIISENENISLENTKLKATIAALEMSVISAEAELIALHEEAQQQEELVEKYRIEVGKLEMEAIELETRHERILQDSKRVTEAKDLEMDTMRSQTEARLKELEHVRDLQKEAEEKLQKCQESLLSCQKSCLDQSKTIRELQLQVGDSGGFLEQLSLEEENRNIQRKYEEVKRKLEEVELQNKELEHQLASQEESLRNTELKFKQKLADGDALTRQLEAALEDGRKKLTEEMEKITSKEQAFQMKILDLENELRKKKEEQKQLSRRLDAREKHHEVSLKELEHNLQRSENQTQSIQNYVKFLKASYVTMFG
uniref:Protein BCAP isoform X3 n=1 Tax=Pogona vitticeps TaxID=103695 RepID=A0ABM5G8L9_9SAUR